MRIVLIFVVALSLSACAGTRQKLADWIEPTQCTAEDEG